jgi:2-hydroxy-6-oxonona-2,4-dienedioate hydrolase
MDNPKQQSYREAEQRLWRDAGVTPTKHYFHLPVAGGTVRVQKLGEGPPVLFIHGGPSSGSEWAFLVARLPDFVDRLVPALLDALGPRW